jgi:hypothetical protein
MTYTRDGIMYKEASKTPARKQGYDYCMERNDCDEGVYKSCAILSAQELKTTSIKRC